MIYKLTGILCYGSNGEEDELLAVLGDDHRVEIIAEWAQDNIGIVPVQVTVHYYTSTTARSEEEVKEKAIQTLVGGISVDYGARYSDITGYLWTDEQLKIGGHDLIAELTNHLGKFLHLEIEVHP